MRVYNLNIVPSSEPMVSQGARGNSVTQLQEALVNAGFNPGGVDGAFGPGTRAALVSFQRAHGLTADGVAGPNTWRALAAAANGSSSPSPAPKPAGEPTLSIGATGGAVKSLQSLLARDGFSPGAADGVFGRNTLNAVDAFQRSRGLSVDGVVGSRTWAALQAAPAKPTGTPPPVSSGGEPTLSSGASGPAVKKLQSMLTAAGFNTHGVDGSFGPNTQSALMSYQSSRGLAVDGVAGPATWGALDRNAPAVRSGQLPPTGGTSANSVAQRFLGEAQHQLEFSGQLPEDRWPPTSEDCANFVSACLQVAGKLPASQHNDNVVGLKNNLLADGWREIPLSEAKPGDVCCFDGPGGPYQHVELFNAWNGSRPQYIGSNNILSDGTQEISYDDGSWAYNVHVFAPPG